MVEGKSLDAMLADYDWYDEYYVLTGPDVGPLVKADFLAAQRGFTLDFSQAAPDLNYLLDGFHQDPSQPSRVWFTLRYVGTHTGSTRIGSTVLEPKENNAIFGGPELHAIWWTPDKRIKWESVGYVGCKYTGSNQGYGGIGGLLVPLGVPRAFFDVGTPFIKAAFTLSQFAEASENGGRAKSPWTSLPAWWKARKDLGLNVRGRFSLKYLAHERSHRGGDVAARRVERERARRLVGEAHLLELRELRRASARRRLGAGRNVAGACSDAAIAAASASSSSSPPPDVRSPRDWSTSPRRCQSWSEVNARLAPASPPDAGGGAAGGAGSAGRRRRRRRRAAAAEPRRSRAASRFSRSLIPASAAPLPSAWPPDMPGPLVAGVLP